MDKKDIKKIIAFLIDAIFLFLLVIFSFVSAFFWVFISIVLFTKNIFNQKRRQGVQDE